MAGDVRRSRVGASHEGQRDRSVSTHDSHRPRQGVRLLPFPTTNGRCLSESHGWLPRSRAADTSPNRADGCRHAHDARGTSMAVPAQAVRSWSVRPRVAGKPGIDARESAVRGTENVAEPLWRYVACVTMAQRMMEVGHAYLVEPRGCGF